MQANAAQGQGVDAAVQQALGSTVDGAVQLLSQLVVQSLQPVVEHLAQSRSQQLGLHRVLMQVATRMQEQIDQQRNHVQAPVTTLRADEIDKAFDRMQGGQQ